MNKLENLETMHATIEKTREAKFTVKKKGQG